MAFKRDQRPSLVASIDRVWRAYDIDNSSYVTGADAGWNILFIHDAMKTKTLLCTPSNLASVVDSMAHKEVLGVQLAPGMYIPQLLHANLCNSTTELDEVRRGYFSLNGKLLEIPDFENVEQFVDALVKARLLERDPIVMDALEREAPGVSVRSVERHFKRTTGMTPRYVRQINRAKSAADALYQGNPISEVMLESGYADQAHMTRQLKHFLGYTPGQIVRIAH